MGKKKLSSEQGVANRLPNQDADNSNNLQNDDDNNDRDGNNNNNNIFDQTITSEEPPPYSSSSLVFDNSGGRPVPNTVSSTTSTTAIKMFSPASSVFPLINFHKYIIPQAQLSRDGSTISVYHPSLSTHAETLVNFIKEQASLPPLPYIHVQGKDHGTLEKNFDLKINMLPMFLSQGQNGWNYVKLVAEGEMAYRGRNTVSISPNVNGGLEEWATRFCKESSSTKSYVSIFSSISDEFIVFFKKKKEEEEKKGRGGNISDDISDRFVLTRQLSNWNTSYIEGQIRSLIASTGYNGSVTVTFPVKYSKIIVFPPRGTGFNDFFTTLVSPLLDKKRYEVVRAVWPYASLPPSPPGPTSSNRVPVVQGEEMWWEEWRDILRYAILSKKCSGWVSVDDMLDFRMAPHAIDPTNAFS